MDRPDVIIDVFGVFSDTHISESLQNLTFRHSLQTVGHRDQVLERTSQISLGLLVLAPQTLQIFFNLIA
jgi:hypothetical protein